MASRAFDPGRRLDDNERDWLRNVSTCEEAVVMAIFVALGNINWGEAQRRAATVLRHVT
jgi:hypothetical protein